MTPEEILKQFIDKMASLEDDNDIDTMVKANSQAIKAIKQYAREICDKQIEICIKTFGDTTSDADVDCLTYKTDYPKELE